MITTLYITCTGDMLRLGIPALVTLDEYPDVSRTWVRRAIVELPEGYYVGEANCCKRMIFKAGKEGAFDLAADSHDNPVLIDHTDGGKFIRLPILSEGW